MRYFSKEKYIEVEGKKAYLKNKGWVDLCDGKEVKERKNRSNDKKKRCYFCKFARMGNRNIGGNKMFDLIIIIGLLYGFCFAAFVFMCLIQLISYRIFNFNIYKWLMKKGGAL